MAYLKRRQLEARMVAVELAKILYAPTGPQARADGAIEISPEAMLAMFGQGGK